MEHNALEPERDFTQLHREYNYDGERGLWAMVLVIVVWAFMFAWGEYKSETQSEAGIVPPQISYRRQKEDEGEPEPGRVGDGRDSFWWPKCWPSIGQLITAK